jgi:hypothetical protein
MKKAKWTLENLQTEALKYKSRGDFAKHNNSAYQGARKLNVLDKVCSHMPKIIDRSSVNSPKFKWSMEKIREEALKYKTRTDFQSNSSGAYKAATNSNVLDKVCSHMIPTHNVWTFEKLQAEALKFSTRKEFSINSNAYQIARLRKILDQICSHMTQKLTGWSDKKVQKEALKYNTRSLFAKKSGSAYRYALKNNILDKICQHMEIQHESWTPETLHAEALKYKSRGEFQKNSPGAYDASLRRKILDQICSHMLILGGTSSPEIELFDIIKTSYPKTQKLSINKKNLIKEKPYIQGFKLDIYIPELRKAIEFDGKYWHSFEGLNRSRSHWPEEDIKNYHQIKDFYFFSKGIEILHIKEEDWIKDKQGCIDKCLTFLNRLTRSPTILHMD